MYRIEGCRTLFVNQMHVVKVSEKNDTLSAIPKKIKKMKTKYCMDQVCD